MVGRVFARRQDAGRPLANNTIGVWDTATGKPIRRWRDTLGRLGGGVFGGRSKARLDQHRRDRRTWDVKKGKEELRLTGPSGAVDSGLFPGRPARGHRVRQRHNHRFRRETARKSGNGRVRPTGGIWPLAFSADGRMLISERYAGGSIRMWEVATGEQRDGFDGAGTVGPSRSRAAEKWPSSPAPLG